MNLIDSDSAEDVTVNGTYSFHSSMINEANATYYWDCYIYSTYFEIDIFDSPLYWFRTANVSLNVIEHLVNVTGTHQNKYNVTTGWTVWNNYTGFGGGVGAYLGAVMKKDGMVLPVMFGAIGGCIGLVYRSKRKKN
jgi:hypothetical protein